MSKKNWIMIKRGLSQDPKHREKIGQAIWCFMHIIDRADWETGIVYDWKDKDEADDMGVNVRTLREWRRSLDENNYITCLQEQYGQRITIHNWINPRNYSGDVLNQFPQGYKKTEPQDDSQGYIQGYTQGSRKDVTPTYSSGNQESTTNVDNVKKISELYEQNIGLIHNQLLKDELVEYSDLPADWLEKAFKIAADNNVRKWSYVRSILNDWRNAGKITLKQEPESIQAKPEIIRAPEKQLPPVSVDKMRQIRAEIEA